MGVVPDVGRDKREEEEEEHVGDERGRRAWATWVLAGPDAHQSTEPRTLCAHPVLWTHALDLESWMRPKKGKTKKKVAKSHG